MNNANKDILINALDNYLLHIQIDPCGDVTPQVNATIALRDSVLTNGYTKELIKSNLTIIVPAINSTMEPIARDTIISINVKPFLFCLIIISPPFLSLVYHSKINVFFIYKIIEKITTVYLTKRIHFIITVCFKLFTI